LGSKSSAIFAAGGRSALPMNMFSAVSTSSFRRVSTSRDWLPAESSSADWRCSRRLNSSLLLLDAAILPAPFEQPDRVLRRVRRGRDGGHALGDDLWAGTD